MLVTFQNKLHETTSCRIYTRTTLHFLCIFLCSSRMFNQRHDLMKANCAHKLPGLPNGSTNECEMGLFCWQAHKSPFDKHYLHDNFLKLYKLLIFLEFFIFILRLCYGFVFRQVKARSTINYFVCILSKIFSTINEFFFILRVEKPYL